MAQRVLSILLGSEIVKVCEVSLAGKQKVRVYNAIDLVIPPGICEDGVILNTEALAGAILEGLKGEGFTAKRLVFSLASKRIASKEATIPFCRENRIKEIIDINASEYFPISNLEDYIINYSILDIVKNENVKNYRLSVIAIPKDMVSGYYELAKAMRMPVAFIDYSGNSILQILKLQTDGNETDAILQVGTESTVVNIMSGSTMILQRNVPYGRDVIVEAVSQARNVPEGVADVIVSQEYIGKLANESDDVADAVRSLFSGINRIIEFYTSRNPEQPISHIYMMGDVLSISGLVDLFNQEWEHSVELIEIINGIEIKNFNNVNYEVAANYLANVGALLAPMDITLPDDREKAKSTNDKMPWWILIFASVISAAMAGAVIYMYTLDKDEIDNIQSQINSYGDVVSLENEYQDLLAKKDALDNWYDSTKGANESLARLFDDLEQIQPQSVKIKKISSDAGVVVIDGSSSGKAPVAEFIIQLKNLDYLNDVHIDYINESVEDYNIKDDFSLSFNLKYDDSYAEENGDAEDVDTIIEEANDPDEDYEGEIVSDDGTSFEDEESPENIDDEINVEDFDENEDSDSSEPDDTEGGIE